MVVFEDLLGALPAVLKIRSVMRKKLAKHMQNSSGLHLGTVEKRVAANGLMDKTSLNDILPACSDGAHPAPGVLWVCAS